MSDTPTNFPNPFDAPPPIPGGGAFLGLPPAKPQTSGKAIAAVILGLAGMVFWVFAALPAIVLGLIAQSEVKAQPQRLKGRGLAWVGVLLGIAGLVAPVFWFSMMVRSVSNIGGEGFAALPGTDRIVHLHLGDRVSEQPFDEVPSIFTVPGYSLKGLVDRLDHARDDDSVKAVVLTMQAPLIGIGQIEELWTALQALADADKPVYVHAGDIQTGGYALASGASHINVVPTDSVWLTGMQLQNFYVSELLDSLGIEAEMLQMGDFKAAGEMMTRDGPSEAASQNMEWLLDGLYGTIISMIAEGRGLDEQQVRALVDRGPFEAQDALDAGLVDSVSHLDEFLDTIRDEFGEDIYFDNHYLDTPKGRGGSFGTLAKSRYDSSVALIYVEGMIVRGYEQISPFGMGGGMAYSGDLVKTLEYALEHPDVHAVVLRVDSPGGSAVASEEILRGVTRLQEAGMPVVVSMGSTAASGGYYIACKADAIYADASTITASIGVVGGKIATEQLWDILGISWHSWKRGANADLLDFIHSFTPEQRAQIETWMSETYAAFTQHVQEGRGDKLKKPLEEMAGGRVYTGTQALELGLVDEIGGLADAIAKAAELADLQPGKYSLRILPEYMTFWETFFAAMRGEQPDSTDLSTRGARSRPLVFGNPAQTYNVVDDPHMAALQAIAPGESSALARALATAKLLGEEKVLALMPEIRVAP